MCIFKMAQAQATSQLSNGDSGIDLIGKPDSSHSPSSPSSRQPPKRPVRRGRALRPESGVYGFFTSPSEANEQTDAQHAPPQSISALNVLAEETPDWEFAIEDDEENGIEHHSDKSSSLPSTPLGNAAGKASRKSTSDAELAAILSPKPRASTTSPTFTFVKGRTTPPAGNTAELSQPLNRSTQPALSTPTSPQQLTSHESSLPPGTTVSSNDHLGYGQLTFVTTRTPPASSHAEPSSPADIVIPPPPDFATTDTRSPSTGTSRQSNTQHGTHGAGTNPATSSALTPTGTTQSESESRSPIIKTDDSRQAAQNTPAGPPCTPTSHHRHHDQSDQSPSPSEPITTPSTSRSRSRPVRKLSTAERLERQSRQPAPTTPDAIVSRRGTVVGRKGSIQDLRSRFANNSGSSSREQSPSQLVEGEDGFSSRRGSVLLKKGVVGRFKGMFHRKAQDLNTPKSLSRILAEKEAAVGAKTGGKLVLYTTSGTTVRQTYVQCQMVLRVLQGHRFKYEERDVMLSKAFANEVKERCPDPTVLPQLFHNGKRLGDAATIEKMNENGTLAMVLKSVPKYDAGEGPCETCAGRFFIPCEWCGGDRKSVMSRFGSELVKLRCTVCNEQGLQKCPECQQQQALEEASEA
eukprot:TRINITY_DN3357_c0_g1_i1.p1 TRINITY_DN3357_c0_g1~~TRINITY_DN3357_c0_g1_i1.p1  ORF type:complete len:634 (+),score=127.20 TRINITY_DN3357_c0_g1_i1:93-1994(+)